jgi:hypothetical protein
MALLVLLAIAWLATVAVALVLIARYARQCAAHLARITGA